MGERRQSLAWNLGRFGERHEGTLVVRHNLAGLLASLGRFAEAEGHFRANVEVVGAWVGKDHRPPAAPTRPGASCAAPKRGWPTPWAPTIPRRRSVREHLSAAGGCPAPAG